MCFKGMNRILHLKPFSSLYFFQVIGNLEYEVYVMFMKQRDLGEDEFLNAVQAMIRPEDVVKHGTKVIGVNFR